MTILKGTAAFTTNSNTVESDTQERVWHTVIDQFGGKYQIYAEDPMEAIKKFNSLKVKQK